MTEKSTKRPPGAKGDEIAITIDRSLETPVFKTPDDKRDRTKDM